MRLRREIIMHSVVIDVKKNAMKLRYSADS